MLITKIEGIEVLDSRGNPTVMCKVWAKRGNKEVCGTAIVPSGASTGEFEALELRDGDKSRFHGKGVLKAIENINKDIANLLVGKFKVNTQARIDAAMLKLDGTPNKAKLGANAILGVSLACSYAAAQLKGQEYYEYLADIYGTKINNKLGTGLPIPMMNIINGGAHADNNVDIQEFMIYPISAKTCTDAIRMGAEVFASLKSILKSRGLSTSVGDEGGFAPNLGANSEGLCLCVEAIEKAGYKPGKDFMLTLDVAASEFYDVKTKKYAIDGKQLTNDQIIDYYEELVNKFPIFSIEDGLDQDDWNGYVKLTKRLGSRIQIVGDDFFCTNTKRLGKGIKVGACNAILIKLNQIGSLTETLKCIKMAHDAGYKTVISHRSGETEDTTISDLAAATNAGQIKTGSLSRTDRTAKYNRLIVIERQINKK